MKMLYEFTCKVWESIFLWIANKFIPWCYCYLGTKHITRKFQVINDDNKYPTGLLWIIGIYFTMFGLADQIYQSELTYLRTKVDQIRQGVNTIHKKYWIAQVANTQNTEIRIQPAIWPPTQTLQSFFGIKKWDPFIVEEVRSIVQSLSDLKEGDLRNSKLNNIFLENANLLKANFENANLESGNLKKADLRETNFSDSVLKDAQLKGAITFRNNFRTSNLHNANLRLLDLGQCNLQGANMTTAQLQGASLIGAKLQGANLEGANLQGADLSRALMTGANLRNAQLQVAILNSTILYGANLEGANLQGAIIESALLSGADLNQVAINGTDFRKAEFNKADLDEEDVEILTDLVTETNNTREITKSALKKAINQEAKLGSISKKTIFIHSKQSPFKNLNPAPERVVREKRNEIYKSLLCKSPALIEKQFISQDPEIEHEDLVSHVCQNCKELSSFFTTKDNSVFKHSHPCD